MLREQAHADNALLPVEPAIIDLWLSLVGPSKDNEPADARSAFRGRLRNLIHRLVDTPRLQDAIQDLGGQDRLEEIHTHDKHDKLW